MTLTETIVPTDDEQEIARHSSRILSRGGDLIIAAGRTKVVIEAKTVALRDRDAGGWRRAADGGCVVADGADQEADGCGRGLVRLGGRWKNDYLGGGSELFSAAAEFRFIRTTEG